ncbi:MAG: metal ABC transporter ATP-binding protein [Myxococcales bacterium]|nr:metal ABC transporter ATP-binding protein [Myxococcales bacterium]
MESKETRTKVASQDVRPIEQVQSSERSETQADIPAVSCRGVTVSYMQKPVLRDVTVDIPKGKLSSITGPNGAGKTTLLRAILGLVPMDAGEIRVLGHPVEMSRRLIAYVPQTETVDWDFPITVEEVVMMGRYPHVGALGRIKSEDRTVVQQALVTVGMEEYSKRHIRQLSGGQQQRVFIARALAQQAEMMILDEPFTGIDASTEQALFQLIGELTKQGKTLVIVNHNLSLLERFDFVVLLNEHVIGAGTPEEVVTPELLQMTYGGRMVLISHVERMLREGSIDVRR